MLVAKIKGGEEGIETVKQQIKLLKQYLNYVKKQQQAKKRILPYGHWNTKCPLCTYQNRHGGNSCPAFNCASDWCMQYIPTGEETSFGGMEKMRLKDQAKWVQSALKDLEKLLRQTRKESKK